MTSEKVPVRAGVYGRESQGKQRSIEDQLEDGRAEADDIGWAVVAEYSDKVGTSRYSRGHRKGWPNLLEDIRSGKINGIIIRDVSRADRKLTDWSAFLDLCRDNKVLIRSVTKHKTYDSGDGDDYTALVHQGLGSVAYAESVRAGSLIGHEKGHRKGRPNGGRAPYGYRRERWVEDGTKIVEQEEEQTEAAVVRWIFKEIVGGTPITTVCAELNRKHPKKRTRKRKEPRWTPSGIRKLVKNVAYIGKRKRNGYDPTKAAWPALVDEETYYAAQNVLAANRKGWRPGRVQHWLTGAITCGCSNVDHSHVIDASKGLGVDGVCGQPVAAFPMRGSEGRLFVYSCPKPGCAAITALRAESYIRGCMAQTLGDPAFRHRLLAQAETTSKEVALARAEVERLEHRLREFRRAAASDESIDPAHFVETIREIESQAKAAATRAEAIALPASMREVVEPVPPGSRRVDPLAGFTEEERQQFIQGMDLFGRWWSKPVAARRKEVRDTLDIRLLPVGRGQRVPIKERLTVRVRATDKVLALDVTR